MKDDKQGTDINVLTLMYDETSSKFEFCTTRLELFNPYFLFGELNYFL